MAVMIILEIVVMYVPTTQGMKISEGLDAPKMALCAMMESGIICKPDVCKTKNIICALEAVSLLGLSSCKLCMAFKPNGVAALSNPNILAEKFIII